VKDKNGKFYKVDVENDLWTSLHDGMSDAQMLNVAQRVIVNDIRIR